MATTQYFRGVAPNQPPTVVLGSTQTNGLAPVEVKLTANPSAPSGNVASVSFYTTADGVDTLLGTATAAPYSYTYQAAVGTYGWKAIVTDSNGLTAPSNVVPAAFTQVPTVSINLLTDPGKRYINVYFGDRFRQTGVYNLSGGAASWFLVPVYTAQGVLKGLVSNGTQLTTILDALSDAEAIGAYATYRIEPSAVGNAQGGLGLTYQQKLPGRTGGQGALSVTTGSAFDGTNTVPTGGDLYPTQGFAVDNAARTATFQLGVDRVVSDYEYLLPGASTWTRVTALPFPIGDVGGTLSVRRAADAVNVPGYRSSFVIEGADGSVPTAPTITNLRSTAVGDNTADFEWDDAGNGITYVVERATNATFSHDLVTDTTSQPRFSYASLPAGTDFFLRVHAQQANANDGPTNVISFTTTGQGQVLQPVAGAEFQGLPRVYITVPSLAAINRDTKTTGRMSVQNTANTSYTTQQLYDGPIAIKIRGNSTAVAPKIPYSITTVDANGADLASPIFGLAAGSDWACLAEYFDPTNLSNPTMLNLALDFKSGRWSPAAIIYEQWIREGDTGNYVYQGIYTWTEKIKRDTNRLAIEKLGTAAADQTTPNVTGGYLIQQLVVDQDPTEVLYTTAIMGAGNDLNPLHSADILAFGTEYPKLESITAAQKTFISSDVQNMEDAIYHLPFTDLANGYRAYVDVPSWVDYFLLKEFSKELDAGHGSMYFYKFRSSKYIMGPGWDYDQSFGHYQAFNNNYLQDPTGFYMQYHFWYKKMFADPYFKGEVNARFAQLIPIFEARIAKAEANAQVLINTGAADRNYSLWYGSATLTYAQAVAKDVAFMRARLAWMKTVLVAGATQELFRSASFESVDGWLLDGDGFVITGGQLRVTNSSFVPTGDEKAKNFAFQSCFGLVPGERYRLTLVVASVSAGSVQLFTGTNTNGSFINLSPQLRPTAAGTYTVDFTATSYADGYYITGNSNIPSTFVIDSISIMPVLVSAVPIPAGTLVAPNNAYWQFTTNWRTRSTIPTLAAGKRGVAGIRATAGRVAIVSAFRATNMSAAIWLNNAPYGTLSTATPELYIVNTGGSTHLVELRVGTTNTETFPLTPVTVLRDDNSPLAVPGGFAGVVGPSTGEAMVTVAYNDPRRLRYKNGDLTPWLDGGDMAYPAYDTETVDGSVYEDNLVFLQVDSVLRFYVRANNGGDRGEADLLCDGTLLFLPTMTNFDDSSGQTNNIFTLALPAGQHLVRFRKRNSRTIYQQYYTIASI